jgi:Xaa-Pro dipeptidase
VIVQGELDGKTTPTVDLYIPEIEDADLMWSIVRPPLNFPSCPLVLTSSHQPPPTIDEARSMHDITNIHHVSELSTSISSLLSGSSPLLIHTLPTTSKFPTHSPAFSALLSPSASSSEYLLPAIHQARLLKDDAEIALIRQANAISSRAHETVMRVLGSAVKAWKAESHGKEGKALLPGEWLIEKEEEAEAIFVASCRREG